MAFTRATGEDDVIAIVVAHALLPWVLLAAWPMVAAAVLTRRWGTAAIAGAIAIAHLGWAAPWFAGPADTGAGSGSESAAAAATPVRLMTANLFALNADVAQVARVIERVDPDIVLFQELTPYQHRTLAAAGALDGFRYGVARATRDSTGSAIYSRLPLEEGEAFPVVETTMTRAVVEVGGRRVRLVNVHVTSPFNSTDGWNGELRALADAVRNEELPVVLAGDFNATRDHAGLRRVLAAGVRDAHRLVGRDHALTWPWRLRRLPPLVRLDRVLVSEPIGVVDVREVGIAGSDHQAVVADLAL